MTKARSAGATLFSVVALAGVFSPASAQRGDVPVSDRAPSRIGQAAGFTYEELVVGGADAQGSLPMIVALHAWGSTPRGMGRIFRQGFDHPARIVLPRGPLRQGSGFAWLTTLASDPDVDAQAHEVRPAAARLAELIAAVRAARPTAGKPIVTGFSQGGVMTFALALLHPEEIDSAFPVAGLLPRSLWPARIDRAYPPIRALHGERDTIVPFVQTRDAVAHLRSIGVDAELTSVRGVGHAFTPEMKDRLRGWLLEAIRARERRSPRSDPD